MANLIFPKFKQAMLSPGVDLVNNYIGSGTGAAPTAVTLKAIMVKAPYAYSAAHEFLSDVGANTVGTAQTLASKTVTNGVLNAASVTFAGVAAGNTANALVLFLDTGTPSTSRLVAFIDTVSGGSAVSVVTNGGDVLINWDTGAAKIFAV